jgi:DNA-binding response OmpR family regulator
MSRVSCAKRILIVDDEWLIAAALTGLIRAIGHEVVGPALNVERALRLISEEEPHAATLDIALGAETSFPIAEALRSLEIPFLFLTGHTRSDLPAKFRNCLLLRKPVSDDVLCAAIEGMLVEDVPVKKD